MKEILERMNYDISYHNSMVETLEAESPEWNFHLGWVDALLTYRLKIKQAEEV